MNNPATIISPSTRCVCERCNWSGLRTDLLRAPNPFALERTILGCPRCKVVGKIRATCIEDGCFERAVFGEFKPGTGWRTHCVIHRPAANGKIVKRIEPLELKLKSRSSVKH